MSNIAPKPRNNSVKPAFNKENEHIKSTCPNAKTLTKETKTTNIVRTTALTDVKNPKLSKPLENKDTVVPQIANNQAASNEQATKKQEDKKKWTLTDFDIGNSLK